MILITTACSRQNESEKKTVIRLRNSVKLSSSVTAPPLIKKAGDLTYLFVATGEGEITAFTFPDAKKVWQYSRELSFEASMLLVGETLYIASLEGVLLAINAMDGSLLKERAGLGQIQGGLTMDPGKQAIYAGNYENKFFKIDRHSLETIWTFSPKSFINGRAVIIGETVVFGSCDATLYILKRADGTLIDSATVRSYIPSTPATDETGTIYFAGYEGHISAYVPGEGFRWSIIPDMSAPVRAPVLYTNGAVISADQRGRIYSFDAKDGKLNWRFESGSAIDFETVNIDEGIISANASGAIMLIDRETGREIASYNLGALPSLGAAIHQNLIAVGNAAGRVHILEVVKK